MADVTATGEFRPDDLDRITARARSGRIYRWVVLGYTELRCTPLHLCMSGKRPPTLELAIDEDMPRLELERGWFWCRLTVHTAVGRSIRVGGLGRQAAETIDKALEAARGAAAAARREAEKVGPRLIELAEEVIGTFDGKRYIRHSSALPFLRRVLSAAEACRSDLLRRQLDPGAAAALRILEETGATKERFEASREAANERFVASARPRVLEASDGVTDHEPTGEQAAAIATDEDVTLVLAGAGAGKTAVIIGKVAHLVRNRKVRPSEILVLAFNREAAKEVRKRLEVADRETSQHRGPSLIDVEVRTFHSFGHRVIAEATIAPTLSRFAGDDKRLAQTITTWLKGLPDLLLSFVAYHRNEHHTPFDFGTTAEYTDYVRSCELRTLSGDKVKSLEEVQVANFLTLHGVHFEYEANYKVQTASSLHRQYQPDFFLPDHDLYIEHFALDEDGRAPKHFKGYEDGVDWKRDVHRKHGTRLIETYSWQCRQGILPIFLERALELEGVELTPVPPEQLLRKLGDRAVSDFGRLVATFLQHVRSSRLTPDELKRRAAKTRRPLRNRLFLEIFERVRQRYESALAEERAIDFNDQIIQASDLIASERWTSHYRYVLVDEFQDISAGRMRLLKELKHAGTAFFLVGDDWQSIYRFTGSDVSLFQNCEHHLGHVRTRNLGATFRYGNGILEPTAEFIQRNPAQTRRELHSASEAPDEGITLVPTSSRRQREGVVQVLSDIEARGIRGGTPRTTPSVLAMGRYNRSIDAVPSTWRSRSAEPRVEFSTVHRAKGLEADYGIVLDLNASGFPSRKEDDPVMEMILPPANGSLPYGEERRLFYVAATRAKRGTYLVVDAERPSPFVRELLTSHPHLRKLGSFAHDDEPPCPRCDGSLIPSRSRDNLRCTNHPLCRHLAPRCWACRKGYLVAIAEHREPGRRFDSSDYVPCSNPHCRNEALSCPECLTGTVIPKTGPHGPFWGCTGFSSADPPCSGPPSMVRSRLPPAPPPANM